MTQNIFQESFLSDFEELKKSSAKGPSWVQSLRQKGVETFSKLGLPMTDQEDWRFTNIEPLTRIHFRPASPMLSSPSSLKEIENYYLGSLEENRLVFINGNFSPELSRYGSLPAGVIIRNLSEALKTDSDKIEPWLGQSCPGRNNKEKAFWALNTAFVKEGAFILIPKNCQLSVPLYLLYYSVTDSPLVTFPRNLIIAQEGSKATIVETYAGKGLYWTNTVTEIRVEANASIEHIKLQQEGPEAFHIATLQSDQQRDSRFESQSASLGGRLTRNDINALLDAEGAEGHLNGLYMVGSDQLIDNHTTVDHARPHGTSRELYKGILAGNAKAVFNGKIIVRPDAQKSDARQTNKNLLISEEAIINTTPQLEIFANDVKCSHGATIGQLDEAAIFYLRSRGIGHKEARSFLIHAFTSEILNQLNITPLRLRLEQWIASRLAKPTFGGIQ